MRRVERPGPEQQREHAEHHQRRPEQDRQGESVSGDDLRVAGGEDAQLAQSADLPVSRGARVDRTGRRAGVAVRGEAVGQRRRVRLFGEPQIHLGEGP